MTTSTNSPENVWERPAERGTIDLIRVERRDGDAFPDRIQVTVGYRWFNSEEFRVSNHYALTLAQARELNSWLTEQLKEPETVEEPTEALLGMFLLGLDS